MYVSHYTTLGLMPGASREDVRRAYRRLAKHVHPDLNKGSDTTADFLRIQEAYRCLSGGEAEVQAPFRKEAAQRPARPQQQRLSRIRCFRCARPTAQPRAITFWTVRSLLLFSFSRPSHGIFCAACARREAMRASLSSALLGWWSLTGIFKTPWAILVNGAGGDRAKGADLSLLWHSAMIFYSRGDLPLAHGLAARVAASDFPAHISARHLLERIGRDQPALARVKLADPWRENRKHMWKHVLLALSIPAALALAAVRHEAQIARGFAEASIAAQAFVDDRWPGAQRDAEAKLRALVSG